MTIPSVCWTYCRAQIHSRTADERGASLVEYALLLGLIAVICIGAIQLIGQSTNNSLSSAASELQ